MKPKTWAGDDPVCNFCNTPINHRHPFVDGRVDGRSSWALFCAMCHSIYGAGLGEGLGQEYRWRKGEWVKTAG